MQDNSESPKLGHLSNEELKPSSTDPNLQTFWVSILISIIASAVFALFIQPIFSFISRIAVGFLNVFYKGFIDSLYEQAAISSVDVPILSILMFITLFPVSLITGLATALFLRRFKKSRASKKNLNSMASNRFFAFAFIIVIVMISVITFTFNVLSYVPMQADATFQQRLSALGPVLSDADRKILLSQWALMQSRADYDKINEELEDRAKKNHMQLPPPLI